MTERKNILYGSIFSYLTIFAEVIISIIFTPFLLKSLGDVDYGIRAFCTSLISYLTLLTLGIGGSYYRFRKIKANEDPKYEKRINGLFLVTFSFISLISLIVGFAIVFLLNHSIITFDKFPLEKTGTVSIILSIMIVQTSLHFPLSLFTLILGYRRKFTFRNAINLVNVIIIPIICTITILSHSYSNLLISVTLITSFVSISIDIIKGLYVILKEKESFTLKLTNDDFKLLKPIFVYCIIAFVASAVSIIHNATDQIILGTVISAEAVTLYSLSASFTIYLNSMITSITSLFTPKLTSDAIDHKNNSIHATCLFVWEAISLLIVFVFGGFVCCGSEFIKGWVGIEKSEIYYYALLLMLVNIISSGVQISYTVEAALNKHKIPAFIYVAFLSLNILLSVFLVRIYSIYGVIIATILSKALETVVLSIYSKKSVGLSLSNYWLSLLKNGLIVFLSYALVKGLFTVINIHQTSFYAQAVIKGFTFCVIFAPCAYFCNKKFIHLFFKLLKKKD